MELLQQVMDKIDKNWDEQIHFLQELGRFPSILGNETEVQHFMQNKYEKLGLETDVFIPDEKELARMEGYGHAEWTYDGRPIVVGKWGAGQPHTGKSLILQGHIDVVSPEPLRLWDYEPWGATIEGDKMYGRGICDMKAGVSAYVYAVQALKDAGIELEADLYLQSVYEEEVTGNGALATIARGYTADAVLIPEPLGPTGVVAQAGVILMRVQITTMGAHVLGADQAVNAIDKAYILIEELHRYRKVVNFDQPKHEAFKSFNHPLNVNVGIIQAGDWASTVPSDCMFEVRIGFYPGQDPQTVKDVLKERLLHASKNDPWLREMPPEITFYGHHAWGIDLDKDLDIFKVLVYSHEQVFQDQMDYISLPATTDAAIYNLHDIPATCYGPIGENMHAPNEYVDLLSVKECTKVYATFILEWCGVRNVRGEII